MKYLIKICKINNGKIFINKFFLKGETKNKKKLVLCKEVFEDGSNFYNFPISDVNALTSSYSVTPQIKY